MTALEFSEFWNVGDDEDAAPAQHRLVAAAQQAVDAATFCLLHSDGAGCRDGVFWEKRSQPPFPVRSPFGGAIVKLGA